MPYSTINIAQINGDNGKYDDKIKDGSVKYSRNAISNYKEYLQPPSSKSYDNLKQLNKDIVVLSNDLQHKNDPIERKALLNAMMIKEAQSLQAMKKLAYDSESYYAYHPLKFELKYIPGQNISKSTLDKKALMAASYEDLGAESVSVEELDNKLAKTDPELAKKVSYKSFDLNNDGKIDVAENATSMLIEDMESKHTLKEIKDSGKAALNADDVTGVITEEGEKALNLFLDSSKTAESKDVISKVYDTFKLDDAQKDFLTDKNNTAN